MVRLGGDDVINSVWFRELSEILEATGQPHEPLTVKPDYVRRDGLRLEIGYRSVAYLYLRNALYGRVIELRDSRVSCYAPDGHCQSVRLMHFDAFDPFATLVGVEPPPEAKWN
jgi:hypothetical protein